MHFSYTVIQYIYILYLIYIYVVIQCPTTLTHKYDNQVSIIMLIGCFLKWRYPPNIPKSSKSVNYFNIEKYGDIPHFKKPPIICVAARSSAGSSAKTSSKVPIKSCIWMQWVIVTYNYLYILVSQWLRGKS